VAKAALARCKIAAGRLTEARKYLERATTLVERPGTPSFYRLLLDLDYLWGRLREAQGRYPDAAARYERYLDDASPRSLLLRTRRRPRLRLALAYQKAGRPGEARAAYQEALALYPAYPRLNYHYAQFLADRDRRETARTHLRRALEGWAPADADFRPRQKAEALADSLGVEIA
jgi:tetratricopeptide (TPR) repeat protein